MLTLVLSSCAYIIPEDPNQPRNNEVPGDRHKPQLNVMVPYAVATASVPTVMPSVAQVPATSIGNVPGADEGRRVPKENAAFQVSAAGYPSITSTSVPPRPVTAGPDSAVEHLRDTQSTLEGDRAAANEARDRLARDAAAEPSMLPVGAPTSGVVPPADPVRVTPIAPIPTVTPVPHAQQYHQPSVNAAPAIPNNVYVPVPTAQVMVPPSMPSTQQFAPPAPMVVASAVPTVPVVNGIQIRPGDFNPMTVPESGATYYAAPPQVSTTIRSARTSYASGGFVAPSRYYTRRY